MQTKDNLCYQKIYNVDESNSLLSGLFRASASIKFSGSKIDLVIENENPSVIRYIFNLVKKFYDLELEIYFNNVKYFGNRRVYGLIIENCSNILYDTYILEKSEHFTFNDNLPYNLLKDEKLKISFIKGLCLGSGSVNNPSNSYHLEIILNSERVSSQTLELLLEFNIRAKLIKRNKTSIIYIKNIDSILKLFEYMELNDIVSDIMKIREVKEYRNMANRAYNCDSANMDRLLEASNRQIQAINKILSYSKELLNDDLYEIAMVRLENPDADLKTIGELLKKPIGKSSVFAKFKKIQNIADKIN